MAAVAMGNDGAMGGRTAGRPRQGREMGSVHLIFLILQADRGFARLQLCFKVDGIVLQII